MAPGPRGIWHVSERGAIRMEGRRTIGHPSAPALRGLHQQKKKESASLEESGLHDARDDGHVESGAHDMACVPERKHVNIRMADSIQNNFLRGVATRPPLGLDRVLAQTKTLDGLTAFRTEWTIFDKRSRDECHRKHACRRMRCGAILMFGTVHLPNM
eukprot:1333567-Amphidinium_carterae.1